jgi:hypothetical protein
MKIDVHSILAIPPKKGARFFAFLEFVKSNEDNCIYYKKINGFKIYNFEQLS